MKKKWVVLPALALMIGINPAFAEDHWGGPHGGKGGGDRKPGLESMLEKLDANSDGKVSKEEFLSEQEARFSKFDANGDGFISKEEIAAHKDDMNKEREDKRKEREDEMFNKMDANGDGTISREEMQAGHEKMMEKMKERREDRKGPSGFGGPGEDDEPHGDDE